MVFFLGGGIFSLSAGKIQLNSGKLKVTGIHYAHEYYPYQSIGIEAVERRSPYRIVLSTYMT